MQSSELNKLKDFKSIKTREQRSLDFLNYIYYHTHGVYISFRFRSDTILMRGKNARIIRWDDVFKKLWEDSVVFQTNSSRTAVLFVDKQDPALVMDIARYYSMFSDKKATKRDNNIFTAYFHVG